MVEVVVVEEEVVVVVEKKKISLMSWCVSVAYCLDDHGPPC